MTSRQAIAFFILSALQLECFLQTAFHTPYCNYPIYEDHTNSSTPQFPYKLKAVAILLRHGDRSSTTYTYPSHFVMPSFRLNSTDNVKFRNHMRFLNHYSNMRRELDKYMMNDLRSESKHQRGLLSPRGALQLMQLGTRFKNMYEDKLTFYDPQSFLVYTTESKRTLDSALAFLHGLLGAFRACKVKIKTAHRQSSFIAYCEGKWCHNLNFKQNSTSLNNEADYVQRAKEYNNENIGDLEEVLNRTCKIFEQTTADNCYFDYNTMDMVAPYVCYNDELPCNWNKQRCVTLEQANRIAERASKRHTLSSGTRRNYVKALIGMSSLLSNVLMLVETIAASGQNLTKHPRKTQLYFLIFSGHDHNITPLRELLIGRTSDILTIHPPYAASIRFEIFVNENKKHEQGYGPFIRMVYNGDDITRNVTFCRNSLTDDLCHWTAFKKFIDNEIGGKFKLKKELLDMCEGNNKS